MANGIMQSADARSGGIAKAITWFFEKLGLLNKGSSESPPTPTAADASQTVGVSTNALNVTRVGGLAATVAAVGAAALAIFNVKQNAKPPIVAAAYASVGLIVAAALVTAAIIISADIRSRVAVQSAPPAPAPSAQAATAEPAATDESFRTAWERVLTDLTDTLRRSEHNQESAIDVWLDAAGTAGLIARLSPSAGQAQAHARLMACQSHILSAFQSLINISDAGARAKATSDIAALLRSMSRLIAG